MYFKNQSTEHNYYNNDTNRSIFLSLKKKKKKKNSDDMTSPLIASNWAREPDKNNLLLEQTLLLLLRHIPVCVYSLTLSSSFCTQRLRTGSKHAALAAAAAAKFSNKKQSI